MKSLFFSNCLNFLNSSRASRMFITEYIFSCKKTFYITIFEAKSILGEGPGGGYPALQDVRFALLRSFRTDHLG
jgi:hypothetical protein